jgi:hypothetical protein
MSSGNLTEITVEDHKNGFNEVAFLLDIFTSTIDSIMGGATAPVGRIAGREMARKLPVYLENPSIEETVALLAGRMKDGFEFKLNISGEQQQLDFGKCVLREVCSLRGVQTGGAMCRLFHSYLDGILNELISRPVKSEIVACGDLCSATVRTQ